MSATRPGRALVSIPPLSLAVAVLTLAFLAPTGQGQPVAPGVLMHVSFERDARQADPPEDVSIPGNPGLYPSARFASGSALPTNLRGVATEAKGKFGAAARTTASKSMLAFDAQGNLLARRGTLALWVRLDSAGKTFKGADGALLYVNVQQSGGGEVGGMPFLLLRVHNGGESMSFRTQDSLGRRLMQSWRTNWQAGEWRHIAVTWDLAVGWEIYMDGKSVARAMDRAMRYRTWTLDNLSLASMAYASYQQAQPIAAAFDELWSFDYVLTPDQIGRLMERNEPPVARTVLSAEAAKAGADWLRQSCMLDELAVPAYRGGALWARRAPVRRMTAARVEIAHPIDGKVQTLWPLRYKGNSQSGSALDILLAAPYRVNYLRALGDLKGRIEIAGVPGIALSGESQFQRVHAQEPLAAQEMVLRRDEGQIHLLDLYELTTRPALELPAGVATYHLRLSSGFVPSDASARRLREDYAPEDRAMLLAVQAPVAPTMQPVGAWQFVHLLTEPLAEDRAIGAWTLDLDLRDFDGPTTMLVQVHDPITRTRRLAEFDLRFAGAGRQNVQLVLDGPPLLAERGRRIHLTLLFNRPGALVCGTGASRLHLFPARDGQREEYLANLSRVVCDQFMFMSEPGPWRVLKGRGVSGNPFVQFKGAGEILDLCEHLLHFDPRHEAAAPILSWMMRWRISWDQAALGRLRDPLAEVQPDMPSVTGPEWAVWGREALRALRRHVDWWSVERAIETGELGSNYEDDTDLVNEYINFALIHDPDNRLKEGYRRLADHCWENHLTDGLSKKVMDHLHAFEEGTNIQHGLSILFYGNPEYIERLMTISRSYENHLTSIAPNGDRILRSHFYSATAVGRPQTDVLGGMVLVFQPGRYLTWYNASPNVRRVLLEWQDTWLRHALAWREKRKSLPGSPGEVAHHLYWAFAMTGDARYSDPVVQAVRNGESAWRMNWPEWRKLVPDAQADSAFLRSRGSAGAAQLGTDRAALVERLKDSVLHMKKYYPLHTWVGQSADRVSIPQSDMARMYLGGSADQAKRLGYHYHAVSWEGADDDVARLVAEDTPTRLKVLLYSFHDRPQTVRMRVWKLAHGRYRVAGGTARDGEERIGQVAFDEERRLARYDAIEFDLPPRQVFVVECEQREAIAEDIRLRPDLAIGPKDVLIEDRAVRLNVHNIGGVDAPASVVRLMRDGKTLAERPIPPLPAPVNLQPRTATVVFGNVGNPERMTVLLDPDARLVEITSLNNRIVVGER